MKLVYSLAVLALAGQAAAAGGSCAMTPLDDKTIQALGGQSKSNAPTSTRPDSGPGTQPGAGTGSALTKPAQPATGKKSAIRRRAVHGDIHLNRRAGAVKPPAAGSSSAVQRGSSVPNSRQPARSGDNVEMAPVSAASTSNVQARPPSANPATAPNAPPVGNSPVGTNPAANPASQNPTTQMQNGVQLPQAPQNARITQDRLPTTTQDIEQNRPQGQNGLQTQVQAQNRNPVAAAGTAMGNAVGACVKMICAPLNKAFNYITGASKLTDPAAVIKLRNDWGRSLAAGLIAGGVAAVTITRQTAATDRLAAEQANVAQQNQMMMAIARCQISTSNPLSDFCAGLANPQGPVKRAATLAPAANQQNAKQTSAQSCPKQSDAEKSGMFQKLVETAGLGMAQSGELQRMGLSFDGGSDAWIVFDPSGFPQAMAQLEKQGMGAASATSSATKSSAGTTAPETSAQGGKPTGSAPGAGAAALSPAAGPAAAPKAGSK
ncbi:Cullin-4 [Sphaceloma murrayae]|uniref:Cullin-4 n=1 Tax=Sphaceloma murrayae TaxID=2082308 RepID=A0A2K1R0Q1_9PEZI|nr:Cullin-4 [Sphaceloma murrayae]